MSLAFLVKAEYLKSLWFLFEKKLSCSGCDLDTMDRVHKYITSQGLAGRCREELIYTHTHTHKGGGGEKEEEEEGEVTTYSVPLL